MSTQLQPWEVDVVRQFISASVIDSRGRRIVNGGNSQFNTDFVTNTQVADGSLIANALTKYISLWSTNIVFSATDNDTVAWTSGTITFFDGTTASISAGNTGNMTGLTYIVYHPNVSNTVLQVYTSYTDTVGNNDRILMCVAKNSADVVQTAFYVPAIGVLGINETQIGPSSISTSKIQALSITTGLLAAASVTAAKINVSQLSAISADIGSISAGSLTAVTITASTITGSTLQTGTSNPRVVIDPTNGIRIFNSTNVVTQMSIGASLGYIETTTIQGISNAGANGSLVLQSQSTVSGGAISILSTTSEILFNTAATNRARIDSTGLNLLSGVFQGSGSSLTALNASNLSSGTVPDARIAATTIPAGNLSGSIADARLSSNVALKNINNSFSTDQTTTGLTVSTNGISVTGGITVSSANINFTSGFGIASGGTAFACSSAAEIYQSSTLVFQLSTSTAKMYISGSLKTLTVVAGIVNAA